MFFAIQKVSKFVADVHKSWERLVRKHCVWRRVVHIVEHRLVVDEGRWDGLSEKGRWTKDKRQEYYTELAEVTDDEGE